MKWIEASQLLTDLSKRKGAQFVTIYTETVPPMLKTNNPFLGRVFCRQRHNVQLNFLYEAAVNRVRDKEGKIPDFEAKLPKWGTQIEGTPFRIHLKKGDSEPTVYLRTRVLRSEVKEYYLDKQFVDDLPTRDQIISFIPKKEGSWASQGVDEEHEIIVRDFKVVSIRAITHNGETYIIER